MTVDTRRVGIWMVALGGAATAVGVVLDAVRHADDPDLAAREGIFDFGSFAHALFFGGIAVAVLGTLLLVVGARLYTARSEVTVGRRLAQIAAPLAAVALVAGCAAAAASGPLGEGSAERDGEAAPAADMATTADDHAHDGAVGADDHAHDGAVAADDHAHDDTAHDDTAHDDTATAALAHGDVIPGTATGDTPCEIAQPAPASPGQVGAGEGGSDPVGEHGHRGIVKQAPLTADERVQLEEQMRQARSVIEQYPTVADAEAGGYHMSTVYVPCIGAHYTNTALVPGFDPAKPSELLYDGTTPDAQIVGLSYLVWNPGGAPEGFAGENDHWHQHNSNGGLCLAGGVVVGGEEMTDADCTARGGKKTILQDIWMVHAWVAPGFECSWGVFAGECPELGGRVGGTAWDEPIAADDRAGETGTVE